MNENPVDDFKSLRTLRSRSTLFVLNFKTPEEDENSILSLSSNKRQHITQSF